MKEQLVAVGWTLVSVGAMAFFVALASVMLAPGVSTDPVVKGWGIALVAVTVICVIVGATILITASALT
jgi:hypothetical protein